MNIHDLRRAAEAMPHWDRCWFRVHRKEEDCQCGRRKLLATLDAVEAHLREMVLHPLGDGYCKSAGMTNAIYDDQYVNFAHGHLAAFLNPPDDDDAA